MTQDELVTIAYEALRARRYAVGESIIPRLIALTPVALELLARRVAADPVRFRQMQKPFAAVIAAGEFDTDTLAGLLFNPARSQVFAPGQSAPARWVGLEALYGGQLVNDHIYYAERGKRLVFLNTDGQTDTLAGAGSIVSNHVPTAATCPDEFAGEAAETLAALAAGGRAAEAGG